MLTQKDCCDYDTCVALKKLGYKESCFGHYFNAEFYIDMPPKYYQSDKYVSAPTLCEAQKWLREEKKIEVNATSDFIFEHHWFWQIKSLINANNDVSYPYYRSYEEALLEGIKEALNLLKEEK